MTADIGGRFFLRKLHFKNSLQNREFEHGPILEFLLTLLCHTLAPEVILPRSDRGQGRRGRRGRGLRRHGVNWKVEEEGGRYRKRGRVPFHSLPLREEKFSPAKLVCEIRESRKIPRDISG